MSPETLQFIGNVGSILSGVGAVVSACFAWSAVAAARGSVQSSAVSESLKYFREINLVAGRSSHELHTCNSIGADTKIALDSLSSFTGMVGSSLITQYKKRVDKWLSEAHDARQNVQKASYNLKQSGSIELDEAVDRLARVEGNLGTIVRLNRLLKKSALDAV